MAESTRTYYVKKEHLLLAIVDECRNGNGFLVTEGPEITSISIDMGVVGDINYLIDTHLFLTIKNELQEIQKIKADKQQKGN